MSLKNFNNKKGFSLLEIVITIIILGISLSAILESFIVGSASSVRIANEVTATNLAKQYMADIYYCSEAGGPVYNSSGGIICNNFKSANGNGTGTNNINGNGNSGTSIWNSGASGFGNYIISPQGPVPLNNYCFYTTITPTYYSTIKSAGGNASIYINGQPNWTQNNNSSTAAIAIVVQTGWYNPTSTNGTLTCAAAPAAYPSVSLSAIFTNY
ncbi:MAG: prepilin-type N-terminal cleavage/methylation domain-containing protein [bacterium]